MHCPHPLIVGVPLTIALQQQRLAWTNFYRAYPLFPFRYVCNMSSRLTMSVEGVRGVPTRGATASHC